MFACVSTLVLSHTSFVFPMRKYLNRYVVGFSEGVTGSYMGELGSYVLVVQN